VASRANRGQQTSATQYLHDLKTALDKALTMSGDNALDMSQLKEVNAIRKDLIGFLKQTNPAYDKARAAYAAESVPINRMEIGQALGKTLTSSTDDETGKLFLNAMRDQPKLIKNKAGVQLVDDIRQPAAGMSQQDLRVIDQISDELSRNAEIKRLVNTTMNSRMSQGMVESTPQLPKTLTMTGTVINAILRQFGQSRDPAVKKFAAEALADPAKFQKILEAAVAKSRQQIGPRVSTIAPAAVTIPITAEMNR
jgi:hypothetical protein